MISFPEMKNKCHVHKLPLSLNFSPSILACFSFNLIRSCSIEKVWYQNDVQELTNAYKEILAGFFLHTLLNFEVVFCAKMSKSQQKFNYIYYNAATRRWNIQFYSWESNSAKEKKNFACCWWNIFEVDLIVFKAIKYNIEYLWSKFQRATEILSKANV